MVSQCFVRACHAEEEVRELAMVAPMIEDERGRATRLATPRQPAAVLVSAAAWKAGFPRRRSVARA